MRGLYDTSEIDLRSPHAFGRDRPSEFLLPHQARALGAAWLAGGLARAVARCEGHGCGGVWLCSPYATAISGRGPAGALPDAGAAGSDALAAGGGEPFGAGRGNRVADHGGEHRPAGGGARARDLRAA